MRDAVISRRSFLAGAVGSVGGLALGVGGCQELPRTPFEGIYTDRFTYRIGDWILVHAALSTPQHVEIELQRHDTPQATLVSRVPGYVEDVGNPESPGETGAGFQLAFAIPSGDLQPGVYSVTLPSAALREENRFNLFNGYPSSNMTAYFVVSAAEPGSHSRLLWVHDSLTGVCYGSFGARSIYGPGGVRVSTVSAKRPGLDRTIGDWQPLRSLRAHGHEFEYVDLEALCFASEDFLDAYDLVFMVGQFEYIPHGVMGGLARYLDGGGNLVVASNEFACFRVRLEAASRALTTFKWHFEAEDPLHGSGSPEVAGVGMNVEDTFWESELTGQTLWASHQVTAGAPVEMSVHRFQEAGWILEGTGIGAGGALSRSFNWFGTGNLIAFDDAGEPFAVDRELTRTPEDIVVWATAPSPDGREWWNAAGGEVYGWPAFAGHAVATWQARPSGAQVVTLPSQAMLRTDSAYPQYRQILLNLVGRLQQRQT